MSTNGMTSWAVDLANVGAILSTSGNGSAARCARPDDSGSAGMSCRSARRRMRILTKQARLLGEEAGGGNPRLDWPLLKLVTKVSARILLLGLP